MVLQTRGAQMNEEVEPRYTTKTTDVFAAENGVKAQSVIQRLCNTGSWFGVKPDKRPNGRLIWPDNHREIAAAAFVERKAQRKVPAKPTVRRPAAA
jgi:hypothetical protein